MQRTYQSQGGIKGIGDKMQKTGVTTFKKDGITNTITGLASIYGAYKNLLPPYLRYELFGDKVAFAEDQNSLHPMLNKDGTRRYDPEKQFSKVKDGEYNATPMEFNFEEPQDGSLGERPVDESTEKAYTSSKENDEKESRKSSMQEAEDNYRAKVDELGGLETPTSVNADEGFSNRIDFENEQDVKDMQKWLIDNQFLAPTYKGRDGKQHASDDGIWGDGSQTAYEKFIAQQNNQNNMQGYRPSKMDGYVPNEARGFEPYKEMDSSNLLTSRNKNDEGRQTWDDWEWR